MTYPNDPYGVTPGGNPPQFPPYAPRKTNSLALASMIVSIVSLVTCGPVGIVGAIMGHKARKQVRAQNEEGDGYATAGIIVGWVGFALGMIGIILAVVWIVVFLIVAKDGGFGDSHNVTVN